MLDLRLTAGRMVTTTDVCDLLDFEEFGRDLASVGSIDRSYTLRKEQNIRESMHD